MAKNVNFKFFDVQLNQLVKKFKFQQKIATFNRSLKKKLFNNANSAEIFTTKNVG